MPRLVDVRRPFTAFLLAPALALCVTYAEGANAQREFVEEVDKDPLADVDLDAPDPAEAEKARKKLDPNAKDPKDPKATDAKDAKDAKDPSAAAVDAGPGSDVADPAAPNAPDDAAFEAGGVRVLETTLDAFLEKWDVRALTVRKGEAAKARKLISDVDEALLDFGVQGIPGGVQAPATANALLLEGRRALEEGSIDEATALVDAAERAAPDLVAVHTQRAHVLWAAGDLGGTLNALMHGVKAHARDPLTTSQLGVRALAVLLAAVVLLAALLAALAGLPALRLLSFDLLHVLPKGAHGGQVLALVVMGAVAPLVVGAGPVFGALWILSLAWLYLSTRERVVTGIVAVACLAMPFGVDALARLASFPGSRADRAHRALFDAHAEPLRLALWAQAAPAALNPPAPPALPAPPVPATKDTATTATDAAAPEVIPPKPLPVLDAKALDALDDYELAALAMWHKREGRLGAARLLLEKITARNPDAAFAHGELGVVNALEGNESVALVEMGKALAADPETHAAAFDASVLHYRGGRTDKAESAVAPVAKGAPDLLNAFRRTTYRAPDQTVTHNRAFVDVYPAPIALLKSGLASSSESQSTADSIARPLLRGQLGTRAAALLVGFPIAWLVLLALRKKIEPCQGCVRCGHPASRRVDGKDVPADTCSQCFHAFVSTRSRIDAGVKLRKEREIITRRTRLGRAILVLGLLFPGAGHLFAGATVRGVLFALFHTLGLGALLFASGTVPMPQMPGPWSPTVALVVCGVIVALVWLVSLRSAWFLSEEASGRGRR